MLKIFKNFSKKDIVLILISILLITFSVFLDLRLPDYMSSITTLIQSENSKMSEILLNGGYMLLCALGSLIFVTICDNVERRGNGNTLKVYVKIKNIPFILWTIVNQSSPSVT